MQGESDNHSASNNNQEYQEAEVLIEECEDEPKNEFEAFEDEF